MAGRPAFEGDKHGGRHYYLEPLYEGFPDAWIDRGPEGPELSRYTIRVPGRTMSLSLSPRADGTDGLVALASIVSKTLREVWMDAFNAFWTSRLPGLKPTAGYPVDAARFRRPSSSSPETRTCIRISGGEGSDESREGNRVGPVSLGEQQRGVIDQWWECRGVRGKSIFNVRDRRSGPS